MTREGILVKLEEIFCDVLGDSNLSITEESNPATILEWDSFGQINIVAACESEFGIRFNMNDIAKIKNAGDIVDIIEGKL